MQAKDLAIVMDTAREYGIPCVTGIPGASELIRTGDRVSVDGWLGIVTIEASASL